MRLLIALFVAGVASSVWAGDRYFFRGNGQCTFTVPQKETMSCSISYLLIDDTFKIDVDLGDGQPFLPTSISATMKRQGPELITVYDAQGENKIGVGEKNESQLSLDFAWSPDGGRRSIGVALSKTFGEDDEHLPTVNLSVSMTHPLYGAEPYVIFEGELVIDIEKSTCLFTKEPADCGL